MKRIALAALILVACRHGEGKNIPEFGECVVGSDKSVCSEGLFCDSDKGMRKEVLKGDTYVQYGACMKMKKVGDACSAEGQCVPPARCVIQKMAFESSTGKAQGTCQNP